MPSKVGVLVTRPAAQADTLCERIVQLDWEPVRFPAVRIESNPGGPWDIEQFDMLIFISKNAVEHGAQRLQGCNPRIRIAAVGLGTSQLLSTFDLAANIVPNDGRWNSEGLLEHPELQTVVGKRILIVRGNGGRELLRDTLQSRGAQVDYAEVYRRALPASDVGPLLKRWRQQISLVLATSNEMLDNLHTLFGPAGKELLLKTPLLVVSGRGVAHARELGHLCVIQADGASDDALLSAMLNWAEKSDNLNLM
jgi:uroporphyrinogen-III synthase